MYYKVCKPFIFYKNDTKNNTINVLKVYALNSHRQSVKIYEAENEKDCMMFDNKEQIVGFVVKLCNLNDYSPKVVSKTNNKLWYNIRWILVE